MERRRDQLNRRRRQELRGGSAGDVALHFCGQWQRRRDHRREVEGCEDREAVARCEERICDWRNRARRDCAEDLGELAVLVEAQAQVGSARRDKLGGPAGDVSCWLVLRGRLERVQRVSRKVCARVQRKDEGEGLGSEEAMGLEEERAEGRFQ